MCGIVAAIALHTLPAKHVRTDSYRTKVSAELDKALEAIKHRGPDAHGQWISTDNRVAFGHVRLSIKDLSPAAHQPLQSSGDGSVHVIVNGEFYEYNALRTSLASSSNPAGPYEFKNYSDSELLLALYERDGLNLFSSLRGEFSFCLYDEKRQLFMAARDRFGVKPLFWTMWEGRLLVASEAKALKAFGWEPEWDVRSLMENGWMHDERSIFMGVRKLMPGSYMTLQSFDFMAQREYWEEEYRDKHVKETRPDEEMISQLRERLYQAIERRTQADVPVGVYLSGGLDSSTVAGILSDIYDKRGLRKKREGDPEPLTFFSVGFDENTEFDETPVARRTAAWLGRPFVTVPIDEQVFADNFEATCLQNEQHSHDLHAIGKFCLSKVVRDHGVKVVLTGEGSDEHFGGYSWLESDFLREPDLSYGSDPLSSRERIKRCAELEKPPIKGGSRPPPPEHSKLARRMLNDASCPWGFPPPPFADWALTGFGFASEAESRASLPGAKTLNKINTIWHPLHTSSYIWSRSVLSNGILTTLGDRTEMAHSIEGRPPFLDHDLTHFSNALPPSIKIRYDAETNTFNEKWILKEAARPYITDELYHRKKQPYLAPWEYKAGGPLHVLLQKLVTEESVEGLGFLDAGKAMKTMTRAFIPVEDGGDPTIIRQVFVIAQLVVLARGLGIKKAFPPELSLMDEGRQCNGEMERSRVLV